MSAAWEEARLFSSDDREELEKPVGPEFEFTAMRWIWVPGHLGDIVRSVPDHCSKVSIAMKQVLILLLVEGLAYNLYKMWHLGSAMKRAVPGFTLRVRNSSPLAVRLLGGARNGFKW